MKKFTILCLTMISLSLNLNSQSAESNNKSEKLKSGNSSMRPSEPKANTFEKGQLDLNIGIGFGRPGNYYYHGFGNGYHYNVTPPLSISVDYGITKNISVGGFFAFTRTKLTYNGNNWHSNNYYDYTETYTWNYFIFGARSAFHFAEYIPVENLDVYAGAMLGNNFSTYNYTSTDPYYSHNSSYSNNHAGVVWGVYAGARYMFTDKIGAFGELGYGISYLTLGLNIKL